MALWTQVFGGIPSLVETWIKSRDKKREHKQEIAIIKANAEVERARSLAHVEATYDNLAQTAMRTSWKDEYLTIVFTMPFIITFLAPFIDAYYNINLIVLVSKSWEAVSTAPEWYQYSLIGIVVATFGLRWMSKSKLFKLPEVKDGKSK